MSTMISVHSIGDSMTGSVNGKQFGVRFTKPRWDAMKELEAKALAATTPDELKGIVEQFMPMTNETYGEIDAPVDQHPRDRAAGRSDLARLVDDIEAGGGGEYVAG